MQSFCYGVIILVIVVFLLYFLTLCSMRFCCFISCSSMFCGRKTPLRVRRFPSLLMKRYLLDSCHVLDFSCSSYWGLCCFDTHYPSAVRVSSLLSVFLADHLGLAERPILMTRWLGFWNGMAGAVPVSSSDGSSGEGVSVCFLSVLADMYSSGSCFGS